MSLTPREHRELCELADLLIQDAGGDALWPGRIRETSLELRSLLDAYRTTTDEGAAEPPEPTAPPHHDP
ncbi:hypothetical protein FHX37_3891 [Haloactinospora alba]|uniref:Uncharacterized protein n=1 Tax=Haloactinospora alba TaxID=405555 RepID=A0A543N9N4_9ACTN|nr:hypothetical protein [Haloactinospora alba]TQN28546.1 hypothetical protein FHX37_3891 [Haloactinospora alba]